MVDLRCMSYTSTNSQILVAGCQDSMFTVDVEKGVVIEQLPTDSKYTIMKKSRYICAATDDGAINVLELTSFNVIKNWKAHSTAINDMDARNDFLVTCGISTRQGGTPMADPLANVYDLKTLKPLPPIPFHAGAAYVRLHPKLQTTSFVASQRGQLQVVDLMNPNNINLRQVHANFVLGMELASSGEALAVSDTDCSIQIWGSPSKIHFNTMSKDTDFADHPPERIPFVGLNGDTPLHTIGMPYYHEKLLSAWPSELIFELGKPPAPVDPAIYPYLQPAELGHYARNPRKTHRHQVENTRTANTAPAIVAPKFLSEKAKETSNAALRRRVSDAAEALAGTSLDDASKEDVVLKYRNVAIKYSKFGVDDFDFRFYNKTHYSGLETDIANSFTNPLLQLFKSVPLLRNFALDHVATNCLGDPCLLCEMGFLFDMLEKADGQSCQATNLLKAFGSSREAANMGLLEDNLANASMSTTIQSVNRYFLKQMATDFRQATGHTEALDEKIVTKAVESIRCMQCHHDLSRPGDTYVTEMIYPALDPKHLGHNQNLRFSSILKASIERETQNRGWCNRCRRYQQVAIRKTVNRMPFVIMINAALNNPLHRTLWESRGWLPEEVGVLISGRQVLCFEGQELQNHIRKQTQGLIVYELVGFVAEIEISEHQRPHLMSFINCTISSRDREMEEPQWHLFNDFLVAPLSRQEALTFGRGWKVPSVLAYQIQTARQHIDDSWKRNLDATLLFHPYSINDLLPAPDCQILTPDEKPTPETPIALDTEFVDLEKEEIDVKADGTQETIRPSRSGLARVSVLRGTGDGIPFIDDYITIREPIVDYKTQYSGIHPGDLDVHTSQHNLVGLKIAYKKLWLLLNLGCVFVGHGLVSDFRKINIQVPKSQTLDTQNMFFHPLGKGRKLSLRFLAWAVFKEYIQEDTSDSEGHDSIEDARMALRLWRKFQEYEDAGIVNRMLEEIYKEGLKRSFRPSPRVGTGGVKSNVPSGRNTPDVAAMGGAPSAPSTPSKGFTLSAGGTSFVPPSAGKSEFGGSPLK